MRWTLIIPAAGCLALLGTPALANCAQDIQQLDTQFKQAEAQTGQPAATPHQTQTLQGTKSQAGASNTQTGASTTMPSAGGGPEAASSEHQREVLKGAGQESPQEQFSAHLQRARQLAQKGDERGCMTQVDAARKLLGTH